MSRRAQLLALCLSLLASAAVLILNLTPSYQTAFSSENSDMPTQLHLDYVSRTNNTTDILRVRFETPLPYATARVLVEDPSETPAKTLRVVNLTAHEERDIQLRTLPALFRVRGVIELPGRPVLTKWVWQGHAHVLIANTPGELANTMEASP